MHTHISLRSGVLATALLYLNGVAARAAGLQPRDTASDLHELLNGSGDNAVVWTVDSMQYNITLQFDPSCPSSLNETQVVGPYTNARNQLIDNATIGDIASDITAYTAVARRNTRRQVRKAQAAVEAYLTDHVLCKGDDSTSIQLHDEFRRKLLDPVVNKITWLGLASFQGFLFGAVITWAVDAISYNGWNEAVFQANVITNGLIAFFAVFLAGIYQELITSPVTANRPTLFFNTVASVAMRIINFLLHRGPSGAQVNGGNNNGDIEMGNPQQPFANQGVGLANGGGKMKRDNDQCLSMDKLREAIKAVSGAKSDDLGLASAVDYSHNAGTCPLAA